jgi:hypothetical protein
MSSSVYLLQEDCSRLKTGVVARCKIGHTNRLDPTFNEFRFQIIRSNSPELLRLIHQIDLPSKDMARKLESKLHARFADKRSFQYYSEWFDLSEEDIAWLCNLDSSFLEQ